MAESLGEYQFCCEALGLFVFSVKLYFPTALDEKMVKMFGHPAYPPLCPPPAAVGQDGRLADPLKCGRSRKDSVVDPVNTRLPNDEEIQEVPSETSNGGK